MFSARRSRSAVLIGSIVLIGAIAAPLPATAAPGDDVLVFSNSNVVDTSPGIDGGEYEWISAAITAAGFDVFPFDGGDGTAAAWTTALTDIEVFVLPEQEQGDFYDPLNPPAWLSEAAKDVLVDWIQAGGAMLQSSACDASEITILNEAVGVSYSNVVDCSSSSSAPRWIDDAALPAALPYANGTYGIDLTSMSVAQLAPLSVWYAGEYEDGCTGGTGETLAAGVFSAGSGRVAFEAWDYYNDGSAGQADWNAVLASLIHGNAAASTWAPATPPEPPAPKAPVTATTAAGESFFTLSQVSDCDDEHQLFRLDPNTALAAPVGDAQLDGDATQGAWDRVSGAAYFPFEDFTDGEFYLMTVDTATGEFATVGEFSFVGLDYFDEIFSLAIGTDGSAYLMAEVGTDDTYYELALFSLDLTDASLTFIAELDDDLLDEPNGFAVDPRSGLFYAFEEDTLELFRVNVASGALTLLGQLDSPSVDEGDSDLTALQIGADGTFWAVFDEAVGESNSNAGMLVRFTLADISGGVVSATEVGIITDDPIPSWSLLLVPSLELAATGPAGDGLLTGSIILLLLGGTLVGARVLRHRAQTA